MSSPRYTLPKQVCRLWLFTTAFAAIQAQAAITNVAWYRLGENDAGAANGLAVPNTTTDLVGGNHSKQYNGPRYTNAVSSGASNRVGSSLAVDFNGVNQFFSNVVVSTAIDNFGLEAWVKPNSTSGLSTGIAYNGTGGNGWGLIQNGTQFSANYGGAGGVFVLGPVVIGTWTHLAVVRDNGTTRLYYNGAEVGTTSASPIPPSTGFGIGARALPGFEFFNGAIDEVRAFTFAPGQFSTNDLLFHLQRVSTLAASGVSVNRGIMNGSANPAGFPTTAWFDFGSTTNSFVAGPVAMLAGNAGNTNFATSLDGGSGGLTWHYRAAVSNSLGVAFGTNQSFTTLPFYDTRATTAGYLTKWRFDNIGGGVDVIDLLNNPRYVNASYDFKSLRTDFSANDANECDNCGLVVRGFFIPTASGPHTFYIAADDGAVLFLSLDENPANKVQIAREVTWSSRRNFIGEAEGGGRGDPPVNRSAPINLVAGARYYIEGAVKEGAINDHLDVAVEGPGDDPVADGHQPISGNRIGTMDDLPGVLDGSVAWCDFDNDGNLDILLTGKDISFVPVSRLFRNTGNATFTDFAAGLPGVGESSVAWGDYDNDGRLDILLTGNSTNGPISQVWRSTESGFVIVNAGLTGVGESSAAWGDYDNDGRVDILLTGNGTNGPISQVWRNTGSGFTNISAGLPGIYHSSVAWGDYNSDGRLDILLTGHGTNGPISQVWRNTGNGFTNINAGLPGVYYSSVAWGDYDNDGRLDFLLTGSNTNNSPISPVWRNTGSGFTTINAGLSGTFSGNYPGSSVAWGDYDSDGRLDFLLTGNGTNGLKSQVWRNATQNMNAPPSAPSGLNVTLFGPTATFTWNAASDAQTPATGLTYNLRVGTTPGGSELVGSMAAANGLRRLPQLGNAQMVNFRSVTVPAGQPLYWSVQAVDTAFAGGPFAPEQSFTFNSVFTPTNGIPVPGDQNGDGLVSQSELAAVLTNLNGNGVLTESNLNLVLSNYFATSPWLYMTNVAGLGGTNVTFALTNSLAGAFSVEYTTNLVDWIFLGPAKPRYLFTDTNAPASPQRHYRLRWP